MFLHVVSNTIDRPPTSNKTVIAHTPISLLVLEGVSYLTSRIYHFCHTRERKKNQYLSDQYLSKSARPLLRTRSRKNIDTTAPCTLTPSTESILFFRCHYTLSPDSSTSLINNPGGGDLVAKWRQHPGQPDQ